MNKHTDPQRNQASMDLLKKMSDWIDEQIEIDEELERVEREWRDRCIKPTTTDEDIQHEQQD